MRQPATVAVRIHRRDMANIIIKKKSRVRKYAQPNEHLGSYDPRVKKQYSRVSKENKETFRREKTVQELARKGFNEAAISGMMNRLKTHD